MSSIFIFVLLLLFSFVLLLFFLRPTSTEVAVQRRLAGLEANRSGLADTTSILKQEAFSSTPWLDGVIRQLPWSTSLSRLIKQSGKEWKVGSVLFGSLAGALGAWWLASLTVSSDFIPLLVAAAVGLSPITLLCILRQRRFRKFDDLLPEAVDLMSRGLRAGHSIGAVIEMVGQEVADPVGSEFKALHKEQTLGLPMRDAMVHLVERMPRDDMRFIATAILLQKESGGNLAQILDKTALLVRERARLRGQLRIYTAQGRITGWILGFAPFVMFALISAVNRNYTKVLFSDPKGIWMVEGALGLMVLGVLVIHKIIDIKV
jgi:tight adherence protein B